MVEVQFINVLKFIYSRLSDSRVNWVLTGSLGLALQGVDIEVNDIDLQTDAKGAYEIEKCLSDYLVRPVRFVESERIKSHFGGFDIEGVQVEVMGAFQKRLDGGMWEEPVRIEQYKDWIEVEGMNIPVLSLDYEYQAYLTLGRIEKAALIKQRLDRGRTE